MRLIILVLFLSFASMLFAQDKGVFVEKKNGFYDEIKKGIEEFEKKDEPEKKTFQVDLDGYDLPTSVDQFKTYWHNPPISQGNTGTCWDFSTTSYFESEIQRIYNKEVKISEMYTAYWEYVEKATGYVESRGESLFAEGSEANAVTRIWKKYGCVPESEYTGMLEGQKFHNHATMYNEMNTYLESVKASNAWNLDEVVATIKSILNHYLGVPPTSFTVDGKEYTPETYFTDYLKLNLDDYVDVLSYKQQPYWEHVEYEVPDNWWHNKDYYNIPLDDFMKVFKYAIENGYTVDIGGDVSEPGKVAEKDVFMVPDFDIPSEYINEDARQFRFSNETTTDDHGIHVVGFANLDGKNWYLIKDSGSSARNGNEKGYYFFSEDYIKLKIMDFMIHKDVIEKVLDK